MSIGTLLSQSIANSMNRGTFTKKDSIEAAQVKNEMKASAFARKDSYGETKAQMEKLT